MKNIKIIGFDADDTLWINEPLFQETERHFCDLLSNFQPAKTISEELFKTEMKNLDLYGYGAKSFMLSMIETALRISNNNLINSEINTIIELGKELLNKPVVLLDGIEEVLVKLSEKKFKIIMATKGDLLDQERKLLKSKIKKYFHHIEIMSDKKESDYSKLLMHLNIHPQDFVMVGNSLKSDIIPVIKIGGYGIYIPFHTTWEHEKIEMAEMTENYHEIKHISEIQTILNI